MKQVLFNRNKLRYGKAIGQPTHDDVRNTFGLFRASVEDALRYGGDVVREAIHACDIRNDRKYVVVDVKVHMLMPGFMPAIPGWHTDGAPRIPTSELAPGQKAPPDILKQEELRDVHYHLLITGEGCLTEFIDRPVVLNVPDRPSPALYSDLTRQVQANLNKEYFAQAVPSCVWTQWDWWDLHRGIEAKYHEWRLLVRIAETDYQTPLSDLREILRTQQQVYVHPNFGW